MRQQNDLRATTNSTKLLLEETQRTRNSSINSNNYATPTTTTMATRTPHPPRSFREHTYDYAQSSTTGKTANPPPFYHQRCRTIGSFQPKLLSLFSSWAQKKIGSPIATPFHTFPRSLKEAFDRKFLPPSTHLVGGTVYCASQETKTQIPSRLLREIRTIPDNAARSPSRIDTTRI